MELLVYSTINITAEILGCVIIAILIFSVLVNGDAKTKQGRLFLVLLVLAAINFFADSLAWGLDTQPGDLARTITVAANFITYMMLGLTSTVYAIYIYTNLSAYAKIHKAYLYIIVAMTVIYQTAIIVSQFTGMLYTIDENNVYATGPYYYGILIYAFIFLLFVGLFILSHQKSLGTKNTLVLSSYAFAPMVAAAFHFFFPDLMLVHIVFMLALLIIYINYQAQQNSELKLKMAENRAAVMLSQIQPHFLYNSLSVIGNLCEEDPAQAQEAVYEFSKYLRGNVDSLGDGNMIPFEQELEHTKSYLALEERRFCGKLDVVYEIGAVDFRVPPLTVQPIVENAVRYGLGSMKPEDRLVLRTDETQDHWHIIISDNGTGFDPKAIKEDGKSHVGIENVRTRLGAMCGGILEIDSAPGRGTTVAILIPK